MISNDFETLENLKRQSGMTKSGGEIILSLVESSGRTQCRLTKGREGGRN